MIKKSSILSKQCGVPIKKALELCPELKKYLLTEKKIDLGNSRALLLYNQTIFKELMGLHFEVPDGYLIPTICSRFEFLKFILNLNPKSILEIGTGASSILALMMGCLGIKVTATEIDERAYRSAQTNVQNNNLSSSINLLKSEGQIILNLIPELTIYDAIICNPPQYDQKYYQERFPSSRGFIGRYTELVGGGKGYEFILNLLSEVRQYTNPPPVFFQLTLPKLQSVLEVELAKEDYQYSSTQKQIGTRSRVYYKVEFP